MYKVLHGGLILSALAVMGLLGGPLFRETFLRLRRGQLTVEALFTLSLVGAFVGSVVSTLTGQGAVYYEVVAVVVVIYTVGHTLASSSRASALQAAASLRDRFDWAWRWGSAQGEGAALQRQRVAVTELKPGETVSVGPSEAITVDGVVASGTGYVNELPLTGEPTPVVRGPGMPVLAGTHSVDGTFVISVTAGAPQRKLDAILEVVEAARTRPSELQRQADQIVRWFVPVVVVVSLLTFLAWLPAGRALALFNAMAVLLVACPCALGLATPVAVFSGLHKLAQLGLVSRNGDFIDALARCDRMLFDKTGTLSLEQLQVQRVVFEEATPAQEALVRAALVKVEAANPHPVAQALGRLEVPRGAPELRVSEVRQTPGQGVTAVVHTPCGCEHLVRVGTPAFAGLAEAPPQAQAADTKARVGFSVGAVRGWVFLKESFRSGVTEGLEALAAIGIECEVLTGDPNPPEVAGLRVRAGLSPADKTAHVEALKAAGHRVIFVGDGINDAAAMTAADAAIAVSSGTDLACASASALMHGSHFGPLAAAVELARRVRKTLLGNVRFAFIYNLIGMGLAATGYLHPVAAALIMLLSSLWVCTRAVKATA